MIAVTKPHSKRRLPRRHAAKNRMPDLRGMGLKDAIYLLESMSLKVAAKGKGKIRQQSIDPGTGISKNQKVTIELN